MRTGNLLVGCVVVLALGAVASAATVWDEGVSGDLSGNQAAPTPILLSLGTNSVIGNLRITAAGDNQDWLAVTVPAGMGLNQYVHQVYTSTDTTGFTGFQAGPTFVGSPGAATSYAGYSHFGTAPTNTIGTDLLPPMQTAPSATGFSIPLAPGTYTFLIQQTGSATTSYAFDFNVIPEPASLGVLLLGGAMLMTGRRARFR